MITSCWQTGMSLSFFQFMVSLQPSGSWIPDRSSIKLKCSLIVTFYLAKPENGTKKSLTQLSYYSFGWRYYFFSKNIFCEKILTSAKLRRYWYSKVHFMKLHMCVYLRTKFQASSIILPSFRQRRVTPKP